MSTLRLCVAGILLSLCGAALSAPADRATELDNGVLRWRDDGSEVALFGVNYCVPFTIEYGALGGLGLDRRTVIEQDVLHLARLGLTCLRMPVWDREISDHAGNLLETEHLALLDHLIAVGKQRGLYMVLTPIVSYATDNESPGFATIYPMRELTSDAGAPRAAQQRYLAQFVQHRNPETGLTYAEDPAVLAFELINEPLYPDRTTDAQVTEYIDALAAAIRETGCRKPILYNGWFDHAGAVAASTADGMTFGWYPTGLVAGRMLTGNYLGLVDELTALHDERLTAKLKGVYEFDAADVGWPYLYPAMARAFRAGGVQFANQFQYDAWPLAASNCAWQTHYLSLPYTSGKAISLMIAGEAFRRLPRGGSFGRTPTADRFGGFRVSYAERLSELVTQTEHLYGNGTSTPPPAPEQLIRVAGVGSSPTVRYEGTGAYFLDRLAPGLWRLEVYPDSVWVADPFARRTVADETARVIWAERQMTLRLPDLGSGFRIAPVNEGNDFAPVVRGRSFGIRPGVYEVTRCGVTSAVQVDPAYFAPPPTDRPPAVWHSPPEAVVEGEAVRIEATCTAEAARVTLCYRSGAQKGRVLLRRTDPFHVVGEAPAEAAQAGVLRYALVLEEGSEAVSFPGRWPGWPDEAEEPAAQVLLDAARLAEPPAAKIANAPGAQATATLTGSVLRVDSTPLDPQQDGVVEVRAPVRRAARGPGVVRVRARALEPATTAAQVTLIQDDGRAYATDVALSEEFRDIDVPLREWWGAWGTWDGRLDPERVTEVSVAYGTWLLHEAVARPQGLEIAAVTLLPEPASWEVPVQAVGPPVPLLLPRALARHQRWQAGLRVMVVPGPEGAEALEMGHGGFGPPPDCAVATWVVPPQPAARRRALRQCDALRITLRSRTPAARDLQIGLTETDGAPWGADIGVPDDWETVDIPLRSLQFFDHWAHPEGRGAEGDGFHPERLQQVTVAFGAWQDPARAAEPHTIQIARMELVRSR